MQPDAGGDPGAANYKMMLRMAILFFAIHATSLYYKYTLIVNVWQLIFYINPPAKASVSKPDTSCIKSEL